MPPKNSQRKSQKEKTTKVPIFSSSFSPPQPQPSNFTNESLRNLLSQSNLGEPYQNTNYSQLGQSQPPYTSSFSQPHSQYTSSFSPHQYNFPPPPQPQSQYPSYDDTRTPFSYSNPSSYGNDTNNPPHFFRQNHEPNYGSHEFAFPSPPPPSQPQTETENEPNKNVYYTKEDDIILARAWVNTTDDAIVANEQVARVYWARVVKCFNEMAASEGRCERGLSSLKNRMNRMKLQMTKYMEAKDMIERDYHSGWNDTLMAEAVLKNFAQRNNQKEFKFGHVVDILLTCSKFNFRTSTYQGGFSEPSEQEPTTPTQDSNSTRESGYSGSKRGSDEITSPSKRPMGNKAAKRASQASKGKGRKLDLDFDDEKLKEAQLKYVDRKTALADLKMKALAEQIERKRLETEEQKELARQAQVRADEEQIIKMDVNIFTGPEKEAYLKKRGSILAKWFK